MGLGDAVQTLEMAEARRNRPARTDADRLSASGLGFRTLQDREAFPRLQHPFWVSIVISDASGMTSTSRESRVVLVCRAVGVYESCHNMRLDN